MFYSCKSLVFVIIVNFIAFGCNTPNANERYEYSLMILKKADFSSNDIDFLLNSPNNFLISERKLYHRIDWNSMKIVDTIYLKSQIDTIFVMSAKINKETMFSYQTTNSINLLIYFSGSNLHGEYVSIIRNKKFEKPLKLLVENEAFILNKLKTYHPNFHQ